jgi:outer membrane protein
VNEQTLETSKKNEQRGMAMLEVGKMSKADVAQLSAQRATDEYNLVKARTDIATNKLQLKQLLELDGNTAFDVFIPTTTDDHALDEIPSVQSVYEQALMSRPEIASKEMDIENKGIGIKVAKAGYMPTISMTGGVGTSTNSLSNTAWGNQFKTNFDASAGVSVAIPIYDKRQAKTAVNKARIARQQAQLDLQAQQKELYKSIETYWLNAETNQQKFRSAITAVQSEQQSFDLLQEQFNLGLKNIVELMTGKDKLLKAQQNKLESKYQTILAQQMLKFYSGSRPLNKKQKKEA